MNEKQPSPLGRNTFASQGLKESLKKIEKSAADSEELRNLPDDDPRKSTSKAVASMVDATVDAMARRHEAIAINEASALHPTWGKSPETLDAAAKLRASGMPESDVLEFVAAQHGVDPQHVADQYPPTDDVGRQT